MMPVWRPPAAAGIGAGMLTAANAFHRVSFDRPPTLGRGVADFVAR